MANELNKFVVVHTLDELNSENDTCSCSCLLDVRRIVIPGQLAYSDRSKIVVVSLL